ncbi:MAG: DNA gyrase inhibitor YacG [Chloracidobacterium sp.]|uniref:DNA gyrase inhibitor YacG n=1 Tax=Chloracidobacterium validum TaxID=2821543 RepID=A0ABX8B7G2_9BACT|nr:DNA gyrase inhibitor YacG [Chloracidobacterium validum]QUW02853.1 DNA gyrase inhibitor YacG [Chloracidobacterium validum]
MSIRCPICGAETAWTGNPTRPFCSESCQLRDLGNWLTEQYAIPAADTTPPSDGTPVPPDGPEP